MCRIRKRFLSHRFRRSGRAHAADLASAIVNSSSDAIISRTLDGRITSWNPAATELFGYGPDVMIGESVRRLIPSDRQDEEDRILARIKAGERVGSYVTVRLDKEQRPINISLTISPIWDRKKIIGVSKIVRAIASPEGLSEALRWRQFVDQAPVAMLVLDRNMVHLACSRRWVELHGVEAGIGRRHYDIFPQVPEHRREAHRRGLAGETVRAEEEVFERPDGGKQWFRWEVRPWTTSDGTVGGITILTEDVTERVLATLALRENEMRMRLAQERARAGAWEWNLADNTFKLSDSMWSLFGLQKPEGWESSIEGWTSAIHPADSERVVAAVLEAARRGRDYEVQWRFNVPDGEPERWFLNRGSRLADAKGGPDRYFGVVIDITGQKLMEQALRESEMRMRLAQEAAKAGAWEWKLADNSMQWSDSLWSLYGVEKQERWKPSMERWAAMIHPADRTRVIAAILDAALLGHDYEVQWRLKAPEGQPDRWFLNRGRSLTGADGSADRYFGVVIDITEQKLAEKALRENEMRMRLAQEAAKAGAWEWRLSDNTVRWSDSLWSLYGLQKPENWQPTLEAWASLVHPADLERVASTVSTVTTVGQDYEIQYRSRPVEDQPERWYLSRGKPLADEHGNLDRYFGVIIEITEQKRMEEALRESKERQTFLLSLNDALRVTGDPDEAMAIASEMLGQKLGANRVSYAEVDETGKQLCISRDWNDGAVAGVFGAYSLDGFDPSFFGVLRSGGTISVCDVRAEPRIWSPAALALFEKGSVAAFIAAPLVKDGRLAALLWIKKRSSHNWKKNEIALAEEVAERTWEAVERARVSQALRESEERLTFALEAAEVGSWEMSLETRKHMASDLALSFSGFPAGAQPTAEEIIARIHPDDQLAASKAFQETAETGRPFRMEYRRIMSDSSIRWFDARAERRSVSGKPVIGGLVQDITERVNQKEAAERAAKAKSEFLSNMSHELRTPMHAILGYSEICTTAIKDGETGKIEKYLKNITASGKRLLGLLNDLLDLAKMEAGRMEYKLERADLKEIVEHTLMELDPLIRAKKLMMQVSLAGRTDAHFDRAHLIQVVVNLVANAIKFSNAGSRIGIELCEDRLGGAGGVRCRITDEGPGILDEELKAVFDSFVQGKKTKTGKGGTGLGLAICDHIIKAHGGRIWAENAKPKGAVFTFVIPESHDASAPIERAA